jgi:hypothetical protein
LKTRANGAVRVIQKSRRLGLDTIIGASVGSVPLCPLIRRAFVTENETKPTVKQDTVCCSDVLTIKREEHRNSVQFQLLLRLSNRQKLALQISFKTVFCEVFSAYLISVLEIGVF